MTMRKITVGLGEGDAAQAAAYPLAIVNSPQAYARGDYYTVEDGAHPEGGPKASAMWVGSPNALAQIGLTAGTEVTSAQLELALQGRHVEPDENGEHTQVRRPGTIVRDALDDRGRPRFDVQGKRVREKVPGVASVDVTNSVPKSVSVAWSQAGPEQRAQIERAVLVAANAALEHMTQTKGVVFRRGADGIRVREPAIGMAAALALHVTARRAHGEAVPSPQLHVHGLIVGVERSDGELVSADTFRLFKDDAPLEGGAVFRAWLAHELTMLGYRIEAGTGRDERYFEIRGVPQEIMDEMSGRTRDVERERARQELESGTKLRGAQLAVLASQTRAPKDTAATPGEMAAEWSAVGKRFGFGPVDAAALCGPGGYRLSLEDRREQARVEILRQMRGRGPTVSSAEARAIVYQAAPGRLSPGEAWELLDEMERNRELIALERNRVTTYEIRALEERVMEVAEKAGAREDGPISDESREAAIAAASAALGEGKALDPEQVEAVRILTAGSGWTVLTGRAGTGKGPTLNAVAMAYRADGWQVIASAADGVTAQRLGQQIGGEAYTIGQVKARTLSGDLRIDGRTLLLIDEASKVDAGDWAEIVARVERNGAHVLAVGHDGQHEAIELPGLFSEMRRSASIPTYELTTIRRHEKVWLKDYQVAIDEGRAHDAIEILDSNGALHFYDTHDEAMVGMVEEWKGWRNPQRPEESVLIVHGSNQDVDRVNELAQDVRLDAKPEARELSGEGIQAVDRGYRIYAGDYVILRESAYKFDRRPDGGHTRRVENGQTGIVDSVDVAADTVRVRLEEPGREPRLVEIDQKGLRAQLAAGSCDAPALRLAYASHTYPVQGATVIGASDLAGHWSQGKEATYVANSRAKQRHSTHTGIGRDLPREERKKLIAAKMGVSLKRDASIRYAWEQGARINVPRPLARPVPELPGSQRAQAERERAATEARAAAPTRDAVTVADPLEAHRSVLGDTRTELLQDRARVLGESLPERDEAWLRERLEQEGAPLEQLDRGAARDARRFERGAALVHVRMEATRREAQELEEKAEALGRVGSRGKRRQLEAKAGARRRLVEQDRAELDGLEAANQRLLDEGRHPDQWMDEHRESAARWAALERELAIRRELEAAAEREHEAAAREHDAVDAPERDAVGELGEELPEQELPEQELPDPPEPPALEL